MATSEHIFFIEKDTFMGLLENAIQAEQVSVIEPLVKRMCDIVSISIYNKIIWIPYTKKKKQLSRIVIHN